MPKLALGCHLSIPAYCPFACIENLSSPSGLPLNRPFMGLELVPFPEPYLVWCSGGFFPHVSRWKGRRVTWKTILVGFIVWNLADDWIISDSHEFAFFQSKSKCIREKSFFFKSAFVDLESFHVQLPKLNAAGRQCHFNINLTNGTWAGARQPKGRNIDFIVQRMSAVRFPVEICSNEYTKLAACDQLGIW